MLSGATGPHQPQCPRETDPALSRPIRIPRPVQTFIPRRGEVCPFAKPFPEPGIITPQFLPISNPMKQVTITTDGSCEPNPGPGGWAAILRFGSSAKEMSGRIEHTTNNGAEFSAIVHALAALKEPCSVLIRADSKCAIAWGKSSSRPRMLTNPKYAHIRDLVSEYRRQAGRHHISFEWLKGHFGDPDNERCDELANDARLRPF